MAWLAAQPDRGRTGRHPKRQERERLEAMGSEPEREEYVRSVWQPTSAHPAALQ